MFRRFLNWTKTHKLTAMLLLAVFYLVYKQFAPPAQFSRNATNFAPMPISGGGNEMAYSKSIAPAMPIARDEVAPTDQSERLVIQETSLSLVVKDVSVAVNAIQQKTEQLGGFLVNSHVSKPQESGNGAIIVRVPSTKLAEALASFRSTGLRVTDEQVNGVDVTDQYVDLDARLKTLEKTKAKFEDILDKAIQVQDLLNVQRELINLQSQIDSVKGQQQLLKKSADLAKITVYLSTDEYSLPYAPAEPWRPNVIFKEAVRALVTRARSLATAGIWIVVFTPIWAPILGVLWFVNKKKHLL